MTRQRQRQRQRLSPLDGEESREGAAAGSLEPSSSSAAAASSSSSSSSSSSATAAAAGAPPAPKRRKLFVPSATSAPAGEGEGDGDAASSSSLRGYTIRRRSVRVAQRESLVQGGGGGPIEGEGQVAASVEVKVKEEDQDEAVTSPPTPTLQSASPRKRPLKKEGDGAPASSPSPRKPLKLNLLPSETKPAPKRWRAQLDVLSRQRRRILAPVDTMGCGDAGSPSRRADDPAAHPPESPDEAARRERFTVLVSLMLSSQTKDEVTAQAVRNLQVQLPGGLSLRSVVAAHDDAIAAAIAKVGFWRRKTAYLKAAALRLRDDFQGDVPRDVDALCSLPGVGPKMAFLALQEAWDLSVGIGVDVHVHRISNRLGWCKTTKAEDTRLALQSWLPKELHRSINKTLVGFGQVVCVPVGPRCDLCDLSPLRLCPSAKRVDPASIASRKQVVFLPEAEAERERGVGADAQAGQGQDGEGKGGVNVNVKLEDEDEDRNDADEPKLRIALEGDAPAPAPAPAPGPGGGQLQVKLEDDVEAQAEAGARARAGAGADECRRGRGGGRR